MMLPLPKAFCICALWSLETKQLFLLTEWSENNVLQHDCCDRVEVTAPVAISCSNGFLPSLDFRLQEGSAVSLRFMVLLQVYLGSGSEWVIKTDAKFLHECVLRGVALPVVPWVGMTVTGWYVMDSWILLVSAIFEEWLTDDG